MNALDVWHDCRRLGIDLSINGDRLHYDGPKVTLSRLLPTMKEHRGALRECVACLAGCAFADGPYLPWGPYLAPEDLARWQRDVLDVVDRLAQLEGWADETYDLIAQTIERQPISTLRPDLAYFRQRLDDARAAADFTGPRASWSPCRVSKLQSLIGIPVQRYINEIGDGQ